MNSEKKSNDETDASCQLQIIVARTIITFFFGGGWVVILVIFILWVLSKKP